MPSRREIIEQFIPASPLAAHLGMRLASVHGDRLVATGSIVQRLG